MGAPAGRTRAGCRGPHPRWRSRERTPGPEGDRWTHGRPGASMVPALQALQVSGRSLAQRGRATPGATDGGAPGFSGAAGGTAVGGGTRRRRTRRSGLGRRDSRLAGAAGGSRADGAAAEQVAAGAAAAGAGARWRWRGRSCQLEPSGLRSGFLRGLFCLDLGFLRRLGGGFGGSFRGGQIPKMLAHFLGQRHINRAGMGFFLRDAGFRQIVDDRLGLDFQLSGQLVDANLVLVCHWPRRLFLVAFAGGFGLRGFRGHWRLAVLRCRLLPTRLGRRGFRSESTGSADSAAPRRSVGSVG